MALIPVAPENMIVGKEYLFTIENQLNGPPTQFYKYAYRELSHKEIIALMNTQSLRLIGKIESLIADRPNCVSMTRVRLALLEKDRKNDDLLHNKKFYNYEEYNPSTSRIFCIPNAEFYEYTVDDIMADVDSRTRQAALIAAINAQSTDPNNPRLPQSDVGYDIGRGWIRGGKKHSKRRRSKKRRSRKRRQSRRKN